MAAEGKAIIFYCCSLFFKNFVSIDERPRPAMGSQPNLASGWEVVSIYKCSQKFWGGPPQIWGSKTSNFGPLFATCALDTALRHISGTKRRIDKQKY